MTDQEQVDGLYQVQGFDHDVEEAMHGARVLEIAPFDHGNHITRTYRLVLDSGHLCIFKTGNNLLEAAADGMYHGKQALNRYGHTPISTTMAECGAWQLAKQLGKPWSDLVVPTVMKFPELPETGNPEVGAAGLFRGGAAGKQGFYGAVPDQVSAGAFFDALIGQQDRNKGNVLWYPERDLIYLIDHSFSFAPPGANRGASYLLEWRFGHGSRDLDESEMAALEKVLASDDCLTLARFIEPERVEAVRERAKHMFDRRQLVTEF